MNWFPPEIQEIIWSYDPTYREKFSRVVHQIEKTLYFRYELVFKKQYQKFFGKGIYGIFHKRNTNKGRFCRVASVAPEFDYHCNSILLKEHKVLLYMETRDVWCYEWRDWVKFRKRNLNILNILYTISYNLF